MATLLFRRPRLPRSLSLCRTRALSPFALDAAQQPGVASTRAANMRRLWREGANAHVLAHGRAEQFFRDLVSLSLGVARELEGIHGQGRVCMVYNPLSVHVTNLFFCVYVLQLFFGIRREPFCFCRKVVGELVQSNFCTLCDGEFEIMRSWMYVSIHVLLFVLDWRDKCFE